MRSLLVLALVLGLPAMGCKPSSSTSGPAANSTKPETYEVKGIIIEITPRQKSVRIKHEEVRGYMPAMTMPFAVLHTNELAGLAAGDPVLFRLNVTPTNAWIDQIRKMGPTLDVLPTTGPFRYVRDVDVLKEGDPLPVYYFTNQFGQRFSTTRFKGRALAINFIYTRCPYPTFCPLMARNFKAAQDKLVSDPNAPTNWHLLTLSFDPEFDTPAVLKSYAETQQYDPARWTFATGALVDVTAIGEQFELAVSRDQNNVIGHNLRTAIIDRSGRVQRVLANNEWTPDDLVAEIVEAAKGK